ncbi:MAG: hypothetical protein LUP93_07765 [Methanomicrobiales archaeon]|nr:hypothetical protein [Methanomicrobiales archaeon]
MALEAREAGLDSLAAAGAPSGEIHGVRLFSAAVIHEQTVKGVIAALRAAAKGQRGIHPRHRTDGRGSRGCP